MKYLYKIIIISILSISLASCSVQSEDSSDNAADSGESDAATHKISVFVDGEEQKGSIAADDSTKIDIAKLKASPDIITETDGAADCASNNVSYSEEIQDGPKLVPQVFDITIDLTRFGKGPEMELMTQNRISQIGSLLDGDLYDGMKMNEGDSVILRFLGTIDYGVRGKNIPLNDRISIKLSSKPGKKLKISDIECVKNERKKLIYLKLSKSNISIEDPETVEDDGKKVPNAEKIRNELNSAQKFVSEDTQDVMDIISKEFDLRYQSNKYSRGTYLLEFLDQTDVLDTGLKNAKTFIFSDANFNLHPNFRKNFANPSKINLDMVGDFNSDVYNKYPRVFKSFYANMPADSYVAEIKKKCKTSKPLYMIGTKNGTNKYFDDILEDFYSEILPSCKITFN